ncbi:MAG: P-loop NTPase, partial [Phycisphaerales bacterium]|nr:P-loop NTPase [Phycisphaerales bacterium]
RDLIDRMRRARDQHEAVRQTVADTLLARTALASDDDSAVGASHPIPRAAPIVAIASGKGGVGKSNIAVNLAIALSMRGLRVTLLDADLGVANADVLCGLSPRARVDGLSLHHTPDLSDLAVAAPGGFTLVPGAVGLATSGGSGSGASACELTPDNRLALLRGLLAMGETNDVLIVDTGAGVGSLVTGLVAAADIGIIVTTPEPTAIADAYALIKCVSRVPAVQRARLESADAERLFLVVNQTADDAEGRSVCTRIDHVSRTFLGRGVGLLACVPSDAAVGRAVRARVPVLLAEPRSAVAGAMLGLGAQVAERLSLGISSDEVRTLTESGLAFPPKRPSVLARLIAATFGRSRAGKS